jgi:hypothetical protein
VESPGRSALFRSFRSHAPNQAPNGKTSKHNAEPWNAGIERPPIFLVIEGPFWLFQIGPNRHASRQGIRSSSSNVLKVSAVRPVQSVLDAYREPRVGGMSCAEMTSPSSAVFSRNQTGDRATHSIQSDQTAITIGTGRSLALRNAAPISHKHGAISEKKKTIGQLQTNPVIKVQTVCSWSRGI